MNQLAEELARAPRAQQPGGGAVTARIEPTRGFRRLVAPGELWRYRDLALQLTVRDIKVRYRQTVLGAAWAVIQPVAIMVVFTIVFGNLAHISSDGVQYPLFSLAALVPWTFFANAVQLGSISLVNNAALVSKIYFPRVFIPAAVVAAGLVDFAISFVVLVAVVLLGGGHPSLGVLALPLLLLMAVAVAFGVSSGLAALNVRYRDVRYVVVFMVQLWLFATPVAYSSTLIPSPWRTLSAINPMVGVVEGFRWAMLSEPACPMGVDRRVGGFGSSLLGGWPCVFRPRRAGLCGRRLRRSCPMGEIAIRTHELGKRYTLGIRQRGYDTLRETIASVAGDTVRSTYDAQAAPGRTNAVGAPRPLALDRSRRDRRTDRPQRRGQDHAAEDPLPDHRAQLGWAEVTGRVGSLLEVGTGFHPELTGRENIFLNGAILGMRRAEIRRRFDEIVAFAEIERFPRHPGQAVLERHVGAARRSPWRPTWSPTSCSSTRCSRWETPRFSANHCGRWRRSRARAGR